MRQLLNTCCCTTQRTQLCVCLSSSCLAHCGPCCLQSKDSAPQQQPDKAGTQISLLKAGCLDALLHLVGASSVVVRSQVKLSCGHCMHTLHQAVCHLVWCCMAREDTVVSVVRILEPRVQMLVVLRLLTLCQCRRCDVCGSLWKATMPASSTSYKHLPQAFRASPPLPSRYVPVAVMLLLVPTDRQTFSWCLWEQTPSSSAVRHNDSESYWLQVVLRIVVQGGDRRERIGALKVVQAFCMANREGQQALTTTIGTATLPPKPHQQTGQTSQTSLCASVTEHVMLTTNKCICLTCGTTCLYGSVATHLPHQQHNIHGVYAAGAALVHPCGRTPV